MADAARRLAVVIPTRNRARLAINACTALMNEREPALHIYVSDNSTAPDQVEELADFCRRVDPGCLTYLRPRQPLSMPAHWDWALAVVLEKSDATHCLLHYDRRILKPGHLRYATELMNRFPDDVVAWTLDQVNGRDQGGWVSQVEWDGRCYAIKTGRVAELTSAGRVVDMGFAFPFLSNCLVPRPVFRDIQQRFGNICHSTGADSCFTYRCCAVRDRYLLLDRALFVGYAMHRSAGWGYFSGDGGDFRDFSDSLATQSWLEAAPIPGVSLGQNMLYHEYELVRRAISHHAFKPVEMKGYVRDLASCLPLVTDPVRAAELRTLLIEKGWDPSDVPVGSRVRHGWPWLRRFVGDIRRDAAFRVRQRRWRLHARMRPEAGRSQATAFGADASAIAFAFDTPRRRSRRNRQLELFQPVEVAAPASLTTRPAAAVLREAK